MEQQQWWQNYDADDDDNEIGFPESSLHLQTLCQDLSAQYEGSTFISFKIDQTNSIWTIIDPRNAYPKITFTQIHFNQTLYPSITCVA